MAGLQSLLPIVLADFSGSGFQPIGTVTGINGPVSVGSPSNAAGGATFTTLESIFGAQPTTPTATPPATNGTSGSGSATATPVSTQESQDNQLLNEILQGLGMTVGAPLPGNLPGTTSTPDFSQIFSNPIQAVNGAVQTEISFATKIAIDAALVLILAIGLWAVIVPEPGKTAITIAKTGAKAAAEGAE